MEEVLETYAQRPGRILAGWTTNTNGPAPPASSCSASRSPAGVKFMCARSEPKVDWAREVEALLRTRYAQADKVILICDNLNTHTKGAFYEAFPPEQARSIVRRLEFRYTPKHGSWLNIAENELSSLTLLVPNRWRRVYGLFVANLPT